MTNESNKYIKRLKKKLLRQFGGKCVVCGTTDNLEFAHVKPTNLNGVGRGRKERYYDILKNPKCYALTCKKHNSMVEDFTK